jgi:hypothetical protein
VIDTFSREIDAGIAWKLNLMGLCGHYRKDFRLYSEVAIDKGGKAQSTIETSLNQAPNHFSINPLHNQFGGVIDISSHPKSI